MKKLMTEEEILDEMEICKTHFNYLEGEFNSKTDHLIRMDIIREMVSEVEKMSELDTLYQKVLLKKYKSDTRKIVKVFLITALKDKFKRK